MEHDECAQAGWEQRGPRVVAIGGGTGLSTMLRGLKNHTKNLTAIVTVADDGGGSGRLRQDLGMPTPGDIRHCMEAQLSFEEGMGCGFGACMGCSCKTLYGNKRICKDGPVLRKEEIIWEK